MKRKHRAGPTAKDIASNPGYVALVERLVALIDKWCATEPGLPDLRWHEPGDTMFIGALQGKALDYLAASPDARRLLEWLDAQTNHEATLFQATVALRMLGHLPRASEADEGGTRWTRRHGSSTCPDCGHHIDASTSIGSDAQPSPGDLGLCLYCGAFLVYGDGVELGMLSRSAFEALPRENREQLLQARSAQRQMLGAKKRSAGDA